VFQTGIAYVLISVPFLVTDLDNVDFRSSIDLKCSGDVFNPLVLSVQQEMETDDLKKKVSKPLL
jgi:hypothetical protein